MCGCSICWFNTVCFVVCIRSFPLHRRPLALSLTVAFNGVSAALFTLAADSLPSHLSSPAHYLLLNSFLPLFLSLAALPSLLSPPPAASRGRHHDSLLFILLYLLALATGVFLLSTTSFHSATPSVCAALFAAALLLLATPLIVPLVVAWADVHVDATEELEKRLLADDRGSTDHYDLYDQEKYCCDGRKAWWMWLEGDGVRVVGEEHTVKMLMKKVEFWLYFVAYFCGGTLGLVYSNNLGQIAQSLGAAGKTDALLTLFSAFSFFGRLLSAAPDFLRGYVCITF